MIYAEFNERSGVYLTDGDSGRIVCQACTVAGGFPRALRGPREALGHLIEHRSGDGALKGVGQPVDEFTVARLEEEIARREAVSGLADFIALVQIDALMKLMAPHLRVLEFDPINRFAASALAEIRSEIARLEATASVESAEDVAARALEAWWRQLGPSSEGGGFSSVGQPLFNPETGEPVATTDASLPLGREGTR